MFAPGLLVILGCADGTVAMMARGPDGAVPPADTASSPEAAADVPEALFDPGPPRAVNPTGATDGSPCARDTDCLHGVCVEGPNYARRCSVLCRRTRDCADLGPGATCALDRAAAGTRLACATTLAGEAGASLEPCVGDADCRDGRCLDGVCAGACASNEDCPPGLHCANTEVDGARLALCGVTPVSTVTVERWELFEGEVRVNEPVAVRRAYVPADAVSATWITHDLDGAELFAALAALRNPNEERVVDLSTWNPLRSQPLRTNPARYQYNAAMVAANDGVELVPGAWQSTHLLTTLGRGGSTESRRMRASFVLKRAPEGLAAAGWTLRIRLVCVGTRGLTAASAPSNPRLAAALATMRTIYRTAGINVEVTGISDLAGDEAEDLGVIDSRDELQRLFDRPAPRANELAVYLVRGLAASAGLEGAIGVAGAILGPPGEGATVQSGVAVGWETTLGRSDQLGFTMAHEVGHFLGLAHTRERLPACTPALASGCSPWGGVDAIDDTPTVTSLASRYLMFWQAVGGNDLISPTQALVMRRNPLLR